MGLLYLRKFQLGREVTPGTAVAATTIWRGLGAIENQLERNYSNVNIGVLARYDSSYIGKYLASPIFDPSEATFEQIFHIFEAGIKTVGTGVADGGGSGKIYNYPFPTTSANTIKHYTIEGGDDIQEEEVEYCFVDSFNLSGKGAEAWMLDATWLGRQVTKSTFTGALSVPTTEIMQFLKSKLYIDAIGGTYGTTQISQTLLEASLKVKTGWVPVWTADGQLYFTFNKCIGPEVQLDVVFEHNASAVAQKDAWIAGTSKKVQLKCEGSALGTPGTTYSYKTMIMNLPGSWENWEKLGEENGNDIIGGSFRSAYNSTSGDAGAIIVVNEVASVP